MEPEKTGPYGALDPHFHLAAIVNSAEDAIISKNLEGIVQSWNPGAERIFGYTAKEMVGQPILALLPAGKEHEEIGILGRLRAGERICGHATQRRRKDGTLVEVSLTISPVLDARGQIVGASKIARDITAEREAEAAQKRLIEQLQTALAEIKDLRSLLPICMYCKKIRDDHGFWRQLESYLSRHSNFDFSHGICPECLRQQYGRDQPGSDCRSGVHIG